MEFVLFVCELFVYVTSHSIVSGHCLWRCEYYWLGSPLPLLCSKTRTRSAFRMFQVHPQTLIRNHRVPFLLVLKSNFNMKLVTSLERTQQ
jgi:hypothetical protein